MKKIFFSFLVLAAVSTGYTMSVKNLKTRAPASKDTNYPTLEFLELRQFPVKKENGKKNHKARFDLSGLVETAHKTVYAISDKEKFHYLYKVDWKNGKLVQDLDLGITNKMDMEAIDICDDTFYLSNEKTNKFYVLNRGEALRTLDIDLSKAGIKSRLFSGNDGFEGLAVDCKNQIMFVTKERQPRFILNIDLKTNQILKKWNIPETDSFDFSDAKFQNGYLYLLERFGSLIAKVDPKTEKVIAKYSYRHIEKEPGYLFGPSIYTFAEALMLTSDEIWIGFDNNGLKATKSAQKELGQKGRDPLIIRFKRPENF